MRPNFFSSSLFGCACLKVFAWTWQQGNSNNVKGNCREQQEKKQNNKGVWPSPAQPPPPPGGGGNKLTNTEQHEFYSVGTGPKTKDVFSVVAWDRTGQDRTGQDRTGQDRTGQTDTTVLQRDVKERTEKKILLQSLGARNQIGMGCQAT